MNRINPVGIKQEYAGGIILNKTLINIAVAMAMGTIALPCDAILLNGSTLDFSAAASGVTQPAAGTGAWVGIQVSSTTTAYTGISSFNGLVLGTVQAASGSHPGLPGCNPTSACNGGNPIAEAPNIDNPWGFADNTAMNQTTSAANVLTATGNTATVDLSGWNWIWNGIEGVPLGAGAFGDGYTDGVANVVCALDCGDGDVYTLDYRATVPAGDPSALGGIRFEVHLEGTISSVPVPAAVWLFCSGLLGVIGITKRKKVV